MDSMQNISSSFNSLTIKDTSSKNDIKPISLVPILLSPKNDIKNIPLDSVISPTKSIINNISLDPILLSSKSDDKVSKNIYLPQSPLNNIIKKSSLTSNNYTKTLYFSGDIIDSDKLFEESIVKKQFTRFLNENSAVKINKDLHITLLYTGGKYNLNAHLFDDLINTNFTIIVDSFAVSDTFFTFKVLSLQHNIPYFGNKFMHLTYIYTKNSKPVDSPSAFQKGSIFTFDKPIILNAIISIFSK